MDPEAVLAAFDEQIRRHPTTNGPDKHVEREDRVVRLISDAGGWTGVTWSDLDPATADALINAQVSRFAHLARPWEWKHYSYDQPPDLPERLPAAGMTPELAETLMVAQIADLELEVPPPVGVQLLAVVDEPGVDALVRVHNDVFNGDHPTVGRTLLAALTQEPTSTVAVIASFEGTAVAAGRVEFQPGTDFASLWGGGHPARLARPRRVPLAGGLPGCPGLGSRVPLPAGRRLTGQQTNPPASRVRVELATTTPFAHPG